MLPDTPTKTAKLPGLTSATLGVCWALAWLLAHRNLGIFDDAVLYTLQALNRIDPVTYSHDLFFRFGSQDAFTIFTPVYALLIERAGLATASVLLVLGFTAWLYSATWLVARSLMPASLAWLGVGLLIVIPAHYGAFQVFKVAEEFITARLPAEAVLLTAIAAFLLGRRAWSYALMVLGGLLHPLMAVPVGAVIVLLALPERYTPRLVVAAAVAVALACLIAAFMPFGPLALMDEAWLGIVHLRSNYLFLEHWPLRSLERVILVLLTLAFMHSVSTDGSLRRLVRTVGIVCVGGLLVTLITQAIPVIIFVQVQPWRALWCATVLAILVLPLLIATVWRGNRADKAVAALIACAWLLQDASTHATFLVPLAIGLWALPQVVKERFERYVVALAVSVVAITATWTIATAFSALTIDLGFRLEHAVVERLRTMFGLASAAVVSLLAAWLLVTRSSTTAVRRTSAIALLVIALPMASYVTWAQWVQPTLRKEPANYFTDWQREVPPGTEVMWLWDPVSTWMLLERPSYLSYAQASGVVFSRETAMTIVLRAEQLRPVAGPEFTLGAIFTDEFLPKPLTLASLRSICADPALGFVVSEDDVGIDAPTKEWPTRGRFIHLYDCRALRTASDT
jgi:hypothetical protein